MEAPSPHRFFRPLLLAFLICVVLQSLTGALLYHWKIGLLPHETFEYYFGSERMLEFYPEARDRFLQPRTFSGLSKLVLGHGLAYGLMVFLLTHLARSLAANQGEAVLRRASRASFLFFVLAAWELFSGFLLLLVPNALLEAAPAFWASLRISAFLAFSGATLAFVYALFRLCQPPVLPADQNANKQRLRRLMGMTGVLIAFSLFSAGCQSFWNRYSIERYAGENEQVVRMTENYLGGAFAVPGTLSVYSAQLNLQKTVLQSTAAQANPEQAAEVVSFYGRFIDVDYIEIPAGESLEVEIDGESFRFDGQGSQKLRGPYSGSSSDTLIQETAYWHQIPDAVLVKLYRARAIRIRLLGQRRELSYFATEDNRQHFRRFLREHLPHIVESARAK